MHWRRSASARSWQPPQARFRVSRLRTYVMATPVGIFCSTAACTRWHIFLQICGPATTPLISSAERSRRAFYKEFVRVVEAADVILEVLDARDPLAYRCREVEQFIRSADPNKKIILLLNKIGEFATGAHGCLLLSVFL